MQIYVLIINFVIQLVSCNIVSNSQLEELETAYSLLYVEKKSSDGIAQMIYKAVDNGKISSGPFRPVSLKCPAENDGVLEVVRKNLEGEISRVKSTYDRDKILYIELDTAFSGEKFQRRAQGIPDASKKNEIGITLYVLSQKSQKLKDIVCDSSDTTMRSRYNLMLNKNSRELK